eukprot:2638093-Prymnesium_polylepis.1
MASRGLRGHGAAKVSEGCSGAGSKAKSECAPTISIFDSPLVQAAHSLRFAEAALLCDQTLRNALRGLQSHGGA